MRGRGILSSVWIACASLAACDRAPPPTPEGTVIASWDVSKSSWSSLRALSAEPRTNHESPFVDPATGTGVRFKYATLVEPTHHSNVPAHVDVVLERNPGAYDVKADVQEPAQTTELPGGGYDVVTGVLVNLHRKAAEQRLLGTTFENPTLMLQLHDNGFVHVLPADSMTSWPTPEGTVLGTWDITRSSACGVKAVKTLPVTAHTTTFVESSAKPPSGLVLRFEYETAEEPTAHVPVIVRCTVVVDRNPNGCHAQMQQEGRDSKLYAVGSEYVLALDWSYSTTSTTGGVAATLSSATGPLQLHADGTVKEGLPMGKEVE
jgi:hypothetical protein